MAAASCGLGAGRESECGLQKPEERSGKVGVTESDDSCGRDHRVKPEGSRERSSWWQAHTCLSSEPLQVAFLPPADLAVLQRSSSVCVPVIPP